MTPEDGRAQKAKEALEYVREAVEIYIGHYRREPYAPESFLRTIDRILNNSARGKQLWGDDRAKLLNTAWRAVCDEKKRPRPGAPSVPDELLSVAVGLAEVAHEHGASFSDGPRGAYALAAKRLKTDFGIVVSPASIRGFRERKGRRKRT